MLPILKLEQLPMVSGSPCAPLEIEKPTCETQKPSMTGYIVSQSQITHRLRKHSWVEAYVGQYSESYLTMLVVPFCRSAKERLDFFGIFNGRGVDC